MRTRQAMREARARALDPDEVTTHRWPAWEEEEETLRRDEQLLRRAASDERYLSDQVPARAPSRASAYSRRVAKRRAADKLSTEMMLALEAAIVQSGPSAPPAPATAPEDASVVFDIPISPGPAPRRSPPPVPIQPPRAATARASCFVRRVPPPLPHQRRVERRPNPPAARVDASPPAWPRRRRSRLPLIALAVASAIGLGLWFDHDARADVASSLHVLVKTLGHILARIE
jgi:hypothetical protein